MYFSPNKREMRNEGDDTILAIEGTIIKQVTETKFLEVTIEWANNGHGHTNTMLGNKHKHTIKSLNEQLINNRIHYRTALQLITGHIGLNKHLYNMNITNTTKCPACDYETETVTHFIGQCPAYSQIRADYFHTYHSNTDDIFNKQSLTRIVGYALKTKRFLTPEEKDQSGVT